MTPDELRALCEEVGSQAEMSRLTKLSRHHVNKLVRGLYEITPHTEKLILLAVKEHKSGLQSNTAHDAT